MSVDTAFVVSGPVDIAAVTDNDVVVIRAKRLTVLIGPILAEVSHDRVSIDTAEDDVAAHAGGDGV